MHYSNAARQSRARHDRFFRNSHLYINCRATPSHHSSRAASTDITALHPMQHGPSHAPPAGHAWPHGHSHASQQDIDEYYTDELEMNNLQINNLKIQL
ncbi:hypothetical protein Pcinc_005964 [Petrolisthes cinctipes]|uniref:Uncharacterized protein n=1 Tax=Petrolisthes cinctipes TaxID=88211 RepID=A0AAE1L007_PETCI|nr:hypothetical protein Pcinc_025547 [Petrolisthes cinctipes]KAK3890047.1 hypothetical protein Pcinc_005962 [Petrolisthes cinctipes]KAK3890049.1 hypothetical protein Pcinc_005964 [Petrolisthes cinctipes]